MLIVKLPRAQRSFPECTAGEEDKGKIDKVAWTQLSLFCMRLQIGGCGSLAWWEQIHGRTFCTLDCAIRKRPEGLDSGLALLLLPVWPGGSCLSGSKVPVAKKWLNTRLPCCSTEIPGRWPWPMRHILLFPRNTPWTAAVIINDKRSSYCGPSIVKIFCMARLTCVPIDARTRYFFGSSH